MPRTDMPYVAGDISHLAKFLRKNLEGLESTPSHVEMLNLLAKAGGFRNYQHLKAQHDAKTALDARTDEHCATPEINYKLVRRLLRFFDDRERLIRWPKKYSERVVCLWVLWSKLPPREVLTEKEISELLKELHLFGDHALLRRDLVDHGLVERTPDGRCYCRQERRPCPEALELLERLHG